MEFAIGGVIVVGLLAGFFVFPRISRRIQRSDCSRAINRFGAQREQLEAKFIVLASSSNSPRGLRWKSCDWRSEVRFGRDRESGLLTAFVGIEVGFEAVAGGDMEGVEAVSTIREAVAVFHYSRGRWGSGGRALFNMNPESAVARLGTQIDPLES